jgi:hypothetical protein
MNTEISRNIVIKSSVGTVLELDSRSFELVVKAYSFVKKQLAQGRCVSVVTTDKAVMDMFAQAWAKSWHTGVAPCFIADNRTDGARRDPMTWWDITFYHVKGGENAAMDLRERAYFWALCA